MYAATVKSLCTASNDPVTVFAADTVTLLFASGFTLSTNATSASASSSKSPTEIV